MPKGGKKGSKGTKRKREEDPQQPVIRKSERQRKKKSFGIDFEEQWSPPRGNGNGGSQQPQADPAPGTSTDPPPDPPSRSKTVTFSSDEEHWKLNLPTNHRKRFCNIRQRGLRKRLYL